jgi:hypothetical protein
MEAKSYKKSKQKLTKVESRGDQFQIINLPASRSHKTSRAWEEIEGNLRCLLKNYNGVGRH